MSTSTRFTPLLTNKLALWTLSTISAGRELKNSRLYPPNLLPFLRVSMPSNMLMKPLYMPRTIIFKAKYGSSHQYVAANFFDSITNTSPTATQIRYNQQNPRDQALCRVPWSRFRWWRVCRQLDMARDCYTWRRFVYLSQDDRGWCPTRVDQPRQQAQIRKLRMVAGWIFRRESWHPCFAWGKFYSLILNENQINLQVQEGNVMAVRICARFAAWSINAKNGFLVLDISDKAGMSAKCCIKVYRAFNTISSWS